jgi:hypothetical protein
VKRVLPDREALTDLLSLFDWLRQALAAHVAKLRATGRFVEDPFRGLFVSDVQVEGALHPGACSGAAADLPELTGSTLRQVASRLGLGSIELAVLAAVAAPAFDPAFEILFAYAQNDATRRHPTIGLMLDLLTGSPLERATALASFASEAPLRANRLLAPTSGDPMAQDQALVLEPGVLPLLLGATDAASVLDGALSFDPDDDPAGQNAVLEQGCARYADSCLLAVLAGAFDSFQRQTAARQAGLAGARLAVLDLPRVAHHDDAALAALVGRTTRLMDACLFIDANDTAAASRVSRVVAGAMRPGRPVFIAGSLAPDIAAPSGCARIEVRLPALDAATRRRAWARALTGAEVGDADALADMLGRTTRLGPTAMQAVIARARSVLPERLDAESLAAASRQQGGQTLARLAKRVVTTCSWDDLVLPADQLDELEVLAAAVIQGPRVAAEWGFSAKGLPNALVALFSGPSGTGKTMAAGLIAQRAGLPLFRVDLSAVVSKYIGETEKQLDHVLGDAEAVGAALLFDEADALFGPRSEVADARDRYANQEVAFLLQRIEAFDGLVILTTNLASHIDKAFLRRIGYPVHFPAPDEVMREALWRRAFPREAPLAPDLDLQLLARTFEITGGNIHNAALGAAHLAAAGDRAIGMRDVVRAVAREVRKLGRLPSRAEFGTLYSVLTPEGR